MNAIELIELIGGCIGEIGMDSNSGVVDDVIKLYSPENRLKSLRNPICKA